MRNDILRSIIESSKGRFMTVSFTKKDGTPRKMNCRMGVTKHLKGGASTTAHKDNLVTVFDIEKNAYRSINLDTVTSISTGGTVLGVK